MTDSSQKSKFYRIVVLASVGLAALCTAAGLLTAGRASAHPSASGFPVCIHEYVSSNTRYGNTDGVFCDWIELYNGSDAAIDIGGYQLTDRSNESRYTAPAGTVIPAGGYHVVYCRRGLSGNYADFSISQEGGETLILMNRRNILIDMVTTVPLGENQAAARTPEGEWTVLDYATPGYENTEAGRRAYLAAHTDRDSGVSISEVVSSNSFYLNPDGLLCDYVELYNATDTALPLAGYMLTDREQEIRFTFARDAVIDAHGYLVVWCARGQSGEAYADFSISRSGGEELLLLNPNMQAVDRFPTIAAPKNAAMVRDADGAVTILPYASPGYPNTPEGSRAALAAQVGAPGELYISEILAENTNSPDPTGLLADFVELHNCGSRPADLTGYGLSDVPGETRFVFPAGTVIEPDGYLAVFCTAEPREGCAPFAISKEGGETILLTDPSGRCIDAVLTDPAPANQSLVRQADGSVALSDGATPGYENTAAGLAAYRGSAPDAGALRISEWMAANGATIADADGDFSDWVELVNAGSEPLSLGRYYLTDSAEDRFQYRLPERTLLPGERVIVFCSGKTDRKGELHAPFRLSASGETVALYDAYGNCAASYSYSAAQEDRSFVVDLAADTVSESAYPTPGYENTAAGYRDYIAARIPSAELMISEAAPSNRSALRQSGGVYYDFVEIANRSSSAVSIGGYRLTDSPAAPDRCVLPDVVLRPGETFLVLCSGDASLSTEKAFHANLSLNSVEDRLFLYAPDGRLLDYLRIYDVPPDGSMARDAAGVLFVSGSHSPGSLAGGGALPAVPSALPAADTAPGVYENVSSLEIVLSGPGEIYYTMDCSVPTAASARYTGPIRIDRTTVIRAVCCEPDKAPSDPLTLSYIVNEGHSLPVVSLVADPADMYGSSGIYSHPQQDWERPASVAFFSADGGFSIACGVRISGQTSRGREHKSFRLLFRDRYGGRLEYPLYPDYRITGFSSLLLRAGLDAKYAVIREPFFTRLALPYKDTTLVQNTRMVVAYVNGVYFGLYILTEAYSEDFYADWFEVSADSVQLTKGYLYDGSHEVLQLMRYATGNDMTVDEHYHRVADRIDLDSLTDWAIFQAYYHNADVSGNVRYYNCAQNGGKWQFALYDVECGMAFSMARNHASFDYAFHNGQMGDLLLPLLQNPDYRDAFLRRLAYHCSVTFERSHVLSVFEELVSEVESEIPRNTARWGYEENSFAINIERIRKLITEYDRPMQLIDDISEELSLSQADREKYFGELLHG